MPIHDGHPQAGWYLTRLVYRGPLLPGSIWLEQPVDEAGELIADETMRAEIMGEPWPADEAWTWLAKRPICKWEYMRRLGELL